MDTNKKSTITKKPVIAPRSGKRAIVTYGAQNKNVVPRPNKQVKPVITSNSIEPIVKLSPVKPIVESKPVKPVATCSSCVARRMAREQLAQALKDAEATKASKPK